MCRSPGRRARGRAHGRPPSQHDVDLLLPSEDVDRALEVLERVGLRTEVPPEGWPVKVFDGELLVDLIHDRAGW